MRKLYKLDIVDVNGDIIGFFDREGNIQKIEGLKNIFKPKFKYL